MVCLQTGVATWRTGWEWRELNTIRDYRIGTTGLAGVRTNRIFGEDLEAAAAFIEREIPPTESLLILPTMTVLYGLTGRESFPGAPFIFHSGVIPFPGRYVEDFSGLVRAHPPTWLLLRDDRDVYWLQLDLQLRWINLKEWVEENYEPVWSSGRMQALRHISRPGESTGVTPHPHQQVLLPAQIR